MVEMANIRGIAEEENKRQSSLPFRIGQGIRDVAKAAAPVATSIVDATTLPPRALGFGATELFRGVTGGKPQTFQRSPFTTALSEAVQPSPAELEQRRTAAQPPQPGEAIAGGLRPETQSLIPQPQFKEPVRPTPAPVTPPAAEGPVGIRRQSEVAARPVPSEPETSELAKLRTVGAVGGVLGEGLGGVPSIDINKVREGSFPIRRSAFAKEGGAVTSEASTIDNFLSGNIDEVMAKLARGESPPGLNLAGNISEQLKNLGQSYFTDLDFVKMQGVDHPLYNDRILSINDAVNNINEIRELIGRGEATPEAQAAIPEFEEIGAQPAGVRGTLTRDPVTGRATPMFFMGTGEPGISPREQAQIELSRTRQEELVREGESRRGLREAQTTAAQRTAERGRFVKTAVDVPIGGTDITGVPLTERRQILVDPETGAIVDPGERLRRPAQPEPVQSLRAQFESLSEDNRSIVERQFADRADVTPEEVLTFIRTLNR